MSAEPHDRCRELLVKLSRYVDGDLAGSERRQLVAHLRRCPCCEDMAESLQRTVDVCHKAGHARLPADVRDRARQRISALIAPAARLSRVKRGEAPASKPIRPTSR